MFNDEDFTPDGLFGSRGITREVAYGAFFRYRLGDPDGVIAKVAVVGGEVPKRALEEMNRRAKRASGIVMRRSPVPEADPFLYAEMRPDRAIWSGEPIKASTHASMNPKQRERHVRRAKTKAKDVRRGMTPKEYERFARRAGGAHVGDHFGQDTDEPHFHPNIAKYLFKSNEREKIPSPDGPHAHTDFSSPEGGRRHIEREHFDLVRNRRDRWGGQYWKTKEIVPVPGGLREDDWLTDGGSRHPGDDSTLHDHFITVDATRYAQRLSSHPLGFARIESRDRVFFLLESCLKEAACVSAGEATFSCPSVSLWNAPELRPFAEKRLRGKVVYVVCDSDWDRPDDDSVIRQTLLARDALRLYGVDAYAAAPPPGGPVCEHEGRKHGVDDHLGPCGNLSVEDLIVIEREPRSGLAEWLLDRRESKRGRVEEGVLRDAAVLRWLATHAGEDGVTRVSLRTVARSVREELGSASEQAAYQAVKRAVGTLQQAGAVWEDPEDPLKERTRHHLRGKKENWVGTLCIVPELRANTRRTRLGEHVAR